MKKDLIVDDYEFSIPFFSRRRTKRIVNTLQNLQNICLFAGAGVTVDQTDLTWQSLITELLVQMGTEESTAQLITQVLTPQQAGSVVSQTYLEQKGESTWRQSLSHDLTSRLYRRTGEQSGRIVSEIAELWLQMAEREERFTVVTTNYDRHIADAITDNRDLATQGYIDQGLEVPAWLAGDTKIVYLHGKVPNGGALEDQPVLSERDYLERSLPRHNELANVFRDNDVLFVGSSIADTLIIDALLETRKLWEQGERKRFAILPLSDLRVDPSDSTANSIVRSYEQRLDQLGVEALFVDHFSQVPQTIVEIRRSKQDKPTGTDYALWEERYGIRLEWWWDGWFGKVRTNENLYQKAAHNWLKHGLEYTRKSLHAWDEDLKLELWLRWRPNDGQRSLRLWASSYASYSFASLARDLAINQPTNYACMNAFRTGRAVYTENPDEGERWRTFIGLPLVHTELEIPVGAMVLSSMTRAQASALGEHRRGEHTNLLAVIAKIGRLLVGDHGEHGQEDRDIDFSLRATESDMFPSTYEVDQDAEMDDSV